MGLTLKSAFRLSWFFTPKFDSWLQKSTSSPVGEYNELKFNVIRARPGWTRVPHNVWTGSSAHSRVSRGRQHHTLLSRQLYALRHEGSRRDCRLCVQRWQHSARLHSRCLYVVSLQFWSTQLDSIELFSICRLFHREIAPWKNPLRLTKTYWIKQTKQI